MGSGKEVDLQFPFPVKHSAHRHAVLFYLLQLFIGCSRKEGIPLLVGKEAAVFQHAVVYYAVATTVAKQSLACSLAVKYHGPKP